jgi:hypothetical protein
MDTGKVFSFSQPTGGNYFIMIMSWWRWEPDTIYKLVSGKMRTDLASIER